MARESMELARTIGHAFSLAHAVDLPPSSITAAGWKTGLQAMADEEIAIGTNRDFLSGTTLGTLHRGAGLLLQGTRAEALPLLLKGFESFRASGAQVRISGVSRHVSRGLLQAARFRGRPQSAERSTAVVEKNDERCHEAELYRLQGELSLAETPANSAKPRPVFRNPSTPPAGNTAGRGNCGSRSASPKSGNNKAATKTATMRSRAIYDAYTEGHATPDLIEAASLLRA